MLQSFLKVAQNLPESCSKVSKKSRKLLKLKLLKILMFVFRYLLQEVANYSTYLLL